MKQKFFNRDPSSFSNEEYSNILVELKKMSKEKIESELDNYNKKYDVEFLEMLIGLATIDYEAKTRPSVAIIENYCKSLIEKEKPACSGL